MKTALITGITGQDGSYLAEIFLHEGTRVLGGMRDLESAQLPDSLKNWVIPVPWNMHEIESMIEVLSKHQVNEIYNFAAFSSGEGMFAHPVQMGEINGLAVARILESIRQTDPAIRFCQASSSEMFGHTDETPQTEQNVFHPRTPYGSAKLYAHTMIDIYRRQHGLFACSAILYNHESPRRGVNFVTRKVARAAAEIKLGLEKKVTLGTLDTRRDWGYAKDYVNAMRLMLRHDKADDYVVATGETHSIRDLCECAFGHLGLDYRDFVEVQHDDSRAPESIQLVGNPFKARSELGWSPTLNFHQLIAMMIDHEMEHLGNQIQSN